MNAVFNETLHSWQTFYFTTAAAAATLSGLMFVALSLGTGLLNEQRRNDFKAFVTPSVFYFVSAMMVSLILLVPAYVPAVLAALLAVGGMIGMVRTVGHVSYLIRAAREHQDFDMIDWLAQIIAPLVAYLLLLGAVLSLLVEQWDMTFAALFASTLILILCAISNTWSLVIWIVEKRDDG